VKPSHRIETLLARALVSGVRALGWRRSLVVGAALGDALRQLGVRRRVALENLRFAFPEKSEAERAAILAEHYRELGRVTVEYARLAELVHAPGDQVVAHVRGLEHLLALREQKRGAVLLTGHFGNFELLGAWLGRLHPVDVVVQGLSNPGVERLLDEQRRAAGIGLIPLGAGIRRVHQALRAGRWVAVLGDQDARRHGVFVPFLGRLASTPIGPARLALAARVPIVMGFPSRRPDGRHELDVDPPLELTDPEAPDAVERLTALHTARLEARIRQHPASWFWLHRRWKTAPPVASPAATGSAVRMALSHAVPA
jgi:KDO2-lipid IV(A) lauroyltransferase